MAKRKQQKQKGNKLLIYGGIGFVFLLLVFAAFSTPTRYGTVKYGICKIIMEQNVPFPDTLQVVQVVERAKFARILYSHTDAFGQYRFSKIQCNFEQDQDYANRKWLLSTLAEQDAAGRSIEQVARASGVNKRIITEYMMEKRSKLPSANTINRVAQAVGKTAPAPVFVLDSISIDNRRLSDEQVSHFQKALVTMVENPPDLALPRPIPKNIADYKQ